MISRDVDLTQADLNKGFDEREMSGVSGLKQKMSRIPSVEERITFLINNVKQNEDLILFFQF